MSFSTFGPLWLVHDDDVAVRERGDETFFHPFLERGRVHRLIVSFLGRETGKAQTSDHRDGLVMAVGNADPQPSPSPAASALRARLVEAPVSSMKTSFLGSRSSCAPNHAWRCFRTSGRCCSSAWAVFF